MQVVPRQAANRHTLPEPDRLSAYFLAAALFHEAVPRYLQMYADLIPYRFSNPFPICEAVTPFKYQPPNCTLQ